MKTLIGIFALITALFGKLFFTTANDSSIDQTMQTLIDLKVFDQNQDDLINPYEVLDVMLSIQKETGKPISTAKLTQLLHEKQEEENSEIQAFFEALDKDGDHVILLKEIPKKELEQVAFFDQNQDNKITLEEVKNFNFEDMMLSDEAEIQEILQSILGEQKQLKLTNSKKHKGLVDFDLNNNGILTQKEVYTFLKAHNSIATFDVQGDVAYMNGVIGSSTPAAILELLYKHPNVHTIEMQLVPGSIDDVSNLRAATYIHEKGINTEVNATSYIASGGTDFFLAGKKRTIAKGAKIGVHSWGGATGEEGIDVPKDDPEHQKYLDYYKMVGTPADFYWYTLEAASASDIHIMTEKELKQYQFER